MVRDHSWAYRRALPVLRKENSGITGQGLSANAALRVQVVAARGLIAFAANTLSSPYCQLKLGAARRSTRVVPKSFCPEWGQSFAFGGEGAPREHVSAADVLKVRVRDKRPLHDDFLGGLDLQSSLIG